MIESDKRFNSVWDFSEEVTFLLKPEIQKKETQIQTKTNKQTNKQKNSEKKVLEQRKQLQGPEVGMSSIKDRKEFQCGYGWSSVREGTVG